MINERIQQLAEQAGLYFYLPNGNVYPCAMSAEECETAYSKFAELIIKECVDVASTYDEPKMSGPGLMIGQMIVEHFGVE